MRKNKKNTIILLIVILMFGITLGYAYLNATLNINGTLNVSSANWNVYWNNIVFGSNNITTVTTPATISTGKTEVAFNVNFSQPGDTYEFTVDAVNNGSINAMIDTITTGVYAANGTTPKTLPDYLEYTVTYADGIAVEENHLLESGQTETYQVRVHYKEDISANQLPNTADNYMFKFSVNYVQANNAGVVKPYYIYYGGHAFIQIGDSLPLQDVVFFDNPQQAKEAHNGVFTRHLIVNNTITESYLGFFEYEGAPISYLRGGVDESALSTKPIYEANKALLIDMWGAENCNIDFESGDDIYTSCINIFNVSQKGSIGISSSEGVGVGGAIYIDGTSFLI